MGEEFTKTAEEIFEIALGIRHSDGPKRAFEEIVREVKDAIKVINEEVK